MNLVDVTVTDIVVAPYQEEDGNWTTTVVTNCYGQEKNKTITHTKRWEVEKYEVGYKWLE